MEMSVSKSNCWKEVEDYKKIFSSIFLESRQILGMVGIYISVRASMDPAEAPCRATLTPYS